jgi:predicted nuclease of restriction endonuclease-like (RecB) superfamily
MTRKRTQEVSSRSLLSDISRMIEEARSAVAVTVNAGLTILYWQIGKRIDQEILKGDRAEYGEEIVATLSRQLVEAYGRGFAEKNLRRMVQFANSFPDAEIVAALSRQLSWSHFKELFPLKKPLQCDFYAEMCRVERWSVRTLRKKIDGMLYERTALSKKPEKLVRQELDALREEDKLTPDLVFKDPYFLDFLGLRGAYAEKDLEAAILREIEQFLLEMGGGFAFIERQKRIVIDGEDFYLDLLLYHRRLRRLVLIDLKLGRFKAAYKGQMELYLRWLEKYEMEPGEETPMGLILCAEGGHEQIELLQLDKAGVRVAKYLTELPPRQELERQLHRAVQHASQRLEIEVTPRKRRPRR